MLVYICDLWLETVTETKLLIQVATAGAQAFLRLGSGAFVSGKLSSSWKRPSKPIELYEFEVILTACHKDRVKSSSVTQWQTHQYFALNFYVCKSESNRSKTMSRKTRTEGFFRFWYTEDHHYNSWCIALFRLTSHTWPYQQRQPARCNVNLACKISIFFARKNNLYGATPLCTLASTLDFLKSSILKHTLYNRGIPSPSQYHNFNLLASRRIIILASKIVSEMITRTLSSLVLSRLKVVLIAYLHLQGCPFCRKVREAASILDIDVLYYPCPSGGPTFRPKVYSQHRMP